MPPKTSSWWITFTSLCCSTSFLLCPTLLRYGTSIWRWSTVPCPHVSKRPTEPGCDREPQLDTNVYVVTKVLFCHLCSIWAQNKRFFFHSDASLLTSAAESRCVHSGVSVTCIWKDDYKLETPTQFNRTRLQNQWAGLYGSLAPLSHRHFRAGSPLKITTCLLNSAMSLWHANIWGQRPL